MYIIIVMYIYYGTDDHNNQLVSCVMHNYSSALWCTQTECIISITCRFHNYNTDYRTESVFGSSIYGNCSSVINYASHHSGIPVHRGSICNGTSVLNNGVIPSLR